MKHAIFTLLLSTSVILMILATMLSIIVIIKFYLQRILKVPIRIKDLDGGNEELKRANIQR